LILEIAYPLLLQSVPIPLWPHRKWLKQIEEILLQIGPDAFSQ
jgi:hypothetical protein